MKISLALMTCVICLTLSAASAQTAVNSDTLDPNGDSNGNGLSVPMPGFSGSSSGGLSTGTDNQGATGSSTTGSSESLNTIEGLSTTGTMVGNGPLGTTSAGSVGIASDTYGFGNGVGVLGSGTSSTTGTLGLGTTGTSTIGTTGLGTSGTGIGGTGVGTSSGIGGGVGGSAGGSMGGAGGGAGGL